MPLTVTDCLVTNNSITITFSDPVFTTAEVGTIKGFKRPPAPNAPKAVKEAFRHDPLNAANYSIFDPNSVDFPQPATIEGMKVSVFMPVPSLAPDPKVSVDSERTIAVGFKPPKEFADGDWVNITLKHIHGRAESGDPVPAFEGDFVMIARQVPGKGKAARMTKDVEDAISYPILTEEVGYPPSVTSRAGVGGGGVGPGGGTGGLGQIASRAIAGALGWKPNASDAKGFVGALTQSFELKEVEGHIESKWNARTYTVQTDLAGTISGAQASLFTRAKVAQDNCLPLLDGLYALNPTADPEYITALRDMAKSQIVEIVKQFGVVPPSILRVNTYFKILLGENQRLRFGDEPRVETDPDKIGGTLGNIRDIYGIFFQQHGRDNPFNNSVDDESDITNFRVISDYMTGLLQSWLSNGRYFLLNVERVPAFLGTQLVLISRQLGVIAETVNEVRFALDSVFIGPNERQTLLLAFDDQFELPAMFLEDVLMEIESSVTDELPRLIKDGGRLAINNNLLPVVATLMNMVQAAHDPQNLDALPDGYNTARVKHALDDLSDQLTQLSTLGQQVGMNVPSRRAMLMAQE